MSNANNTSEASETQAFRNFAASLGYELPPTISLGKITRFPVSAKDKKDAGWFIVFVNRTESGRCFACGMIGDWKKSTRHTYKPNYRFSAEDKTRIEVQMRAAHKAHDEERGKRNEQAREQATAIWSNAKQKGFSAYFKNKLLENPLGIRYRECKNGIEALVPMYDDMGALWGLQRIYENGEKRYLFGQRTKELWFQVGDVKSKIYVAEGIATGFTVHEATGEAVFCAFTANNLAATATMLRRKFGDLPITIAADNDLWTQGNPGASAAKNAAIDAQAIVVFPNFKSTESQPTDFNDLHTLEGVDEVRNQLRSMEKRPAICVTDKQIREILNETWLGLQQRGLFNIGIFRSSDTIVRLVQERDGEKKIEPVSIEYFYGELIEHIDWYALDDGKYYASKPEVQWVKTLIARPHKKLPILEAIVRSPFVTKDGRQVLSPGYHEEYGLFLDSRIGEQIESVPSAPTAGDVYWAKEQLLNNLLIDFPFSGEADRANAVAALILPFVRDEVIDGPTPLHGIEAPTPGSGKGLLADVISIVTTGKPAHPTTLPGDESETRKKLTSLLVSSPSIILIDNASPEETIDSSALASVLTTTRWRDRLLGYSRMVTAPNLALWMLTANNPKYSFEIARRTVRIKLDPNVERPWQRGTGEFKHPHLKQWANENRQTLIRACLVLIQNWFAMGRKQSDDRLGSFENWSSIIGGILQAADIVGFLANSADLYESSDVDSIDWKPFVLAWWEEFGDREVSPSDLYMLCTKRELLPETLARRNDVAAKTKLGLELKARTGRIFNRYKIGIALDAGRHKGRLYKLTLVAPNPDHRGDIGDIETTLICLGSKNEGQLTLDNNPVESVSTSSNVPEVPNVPQLSEALSDSAFDEGTL